MATNGKITTSTPNSKKDNNKLLKNIVNDAFNDVQDDMGNVKSSMEKLSLRMNKLFTAMNTVAKRVDDLENVSNAHEINIEQNTKEVTVLKSEVENLRREACNSKLILNYDKINTSSQNYVTSIKNLLLNDLKLSVSFVNSIGIYKFGQTKHTIVLQLASSAHKKDIFLAKKQLLSGEQKQNYKGLFINEFLTRKNSIIMKTARQLKKDKKLKTAYSINGIVYVKKLDEDEGVRITYVSDLDKFNSASDLESESGSD